MLDRETSFVNDRGLDLLSLVSESLYLLFGYLGQITHLPCFLSLGFGPMNRVSGVSV